MYVGAKEIVADKLQWSIACSLSTWKSMLGHFARNAPFTNFYVCEMGLGRPNAMLCSCILFIACRCVCVWVDRVIVTPTTDSNGARIMGLRVWNLRSLERHKSMKIKIKVTRYGEMRILDWCVNDWCWFPLNGRRRIQVLILWAKVHALYYSREDSRTL